MVEQFANSGDPDQMLRSSASDLGLHCLPVTHLGVSSINGVNSHLISLRCREIGLWNRKICRPTENARIRLHGRVGRSESSLFAYGIRPFLQHQKHLNVRKGTSWRASNENSNLHARPHSLVSLSCQQEETLHSWLSKMCPVKILITLRECTGWSESSLGTHVWTHFFLTSRLKYIHYYKIHDLEHAIEIKINF